MNRGNAEGDDEMKIGLLGMGTIGSGVYEIVQKRADMEIVRVLDLRPIPELGEKLTARFEDIVQDEQIDTVVELMGGLEPAHEFALRAMRAGKNVITANKLMISHHFDEIMRTAKERSVALRLSACVGGGIPYLHNLLRARRVDEILWVGGIVNGTTNLILDTMQAREAEFDAVLREAQRLGYAEADPASDIDGIDARSKLTIAMNLAFGAVADTRAVLTEGLRRLTRADVAQFRRLGFVCRYLTYAQRYDDGAACAYVEPTLVGFDAPEASVRKNDNMIAFAGRHAGVQRFFGQGAGKFPTAYAVVEDLLDIQRTDAAPPFFFTGAPLSIDNGRCAHRYYLRTSANLNIDAQALGEVGTGTAYLTGKLSVSQMHDLAARLRADDPQAFFAGIA